MYSSARLQEAGPGICQTTFASGIGKLMLRLGAETCFYCWVEQCRHLGQRTSSIGPATDKILDLQIVRLVLFAGPATDEIVELQFVKLVVFAGPTADEILELQIVRLQ